MTILAINIPFILETLTLGIIASLIVALAVEIWKQRRLKHHISVTLDSSDVYSSQTGKDVNIRVDYKGEPVENALVILYLSITNDGQEDIMFKSHFSDAIKITSKGYKFLSITSEDDKIKPECHLTDEGASLSWEILKKGESIKLCIAAQSEQPASSFIDKVDSYNNLSFDFRSDCIDSITPLHELTRRDSLKKKIMNGIVMKYAYMIFLCLLFLVFDMSFSSRFDITYKGESYKNSSLLYSPLFKKYVLSSDSMKTKVLSKEDIQEVSSIVPADAVNVANNISWALEIVILLFVVFSLASIVINRVNYSRYKKGKAKEIKKNAFYSFSPGSMMW
jgi:hypothetical protein